MPTGMSVHIERPLPTELSERRRGSLDQPDLLPFARAAAIVRSVAALHCE